MRIRGPAASSGHGVRLALWVRLAMVLAIAAAAAALLSGLASSATVGVQAPTTGVTTSPPAPLAFRPRENWPQGKEEGEVLYGDRVVLRLRASLIGLSPFERAMIAAKRLNDFLEDYGSRGPIRVVQVDEQWILRGGTINIVTCDPETARANTLEPKDLAEVWAKNIREVLEHPELAVATPAPTSPTGIPPAIGTPIPGPVGPPTGVTLPGPGPEGPVGPVTPAAEPQVKTVPVIAAVGGQKIGLAAVTGRPEALKAVKSVAALQGTFQKVVHICALVPTANETPTGADRRLVGIQIVGVRLAPKTPPPAAPSTTGGGS